MQIKKLVIETGKLEELKHFYEQILGLEVKSQSVDKINIAIGSTELVFKQAKAADPFYHFAINIPANKIEEARKWLLKRSELIWIDHYKSDIADFASWHAKSVYFYDPAGNILELIARFDLNNSASEAFSQAQFLSISEMGIVFKEEEINQRTEELLQQYNLSYFDKQAPMPQFKAVGDDEGLFIIVTENRNWFPTSKPSGIFPMEIHFENQPALYNISL